VVYVVTVGASGRRKTGPTAQPHNIVPVRAISRMILETNRYVILLCFNVLSLTFLIIQSTSAFHGIPTGFYDPVYRISIYIDLSGMDIPY
jgi:hypothetical protein